MRLLVLLVLLVAGCDEAWRTCGSCKETCKPNAVKYCDAHKCECLIPSK